MKTSAIQSGKPKFFNRLITSTIITILTAVVLSWLKVNDVMAEPDPGVSLRTEARSICEVNWPLIGNIASLATLGSFLFLVCSKVRLTKERKEQIIQEFTFDYLHDADHSNIYDEVIIDEDAQNGAMFLLSSAPLRIIDFYRINDEAGNPIMPRKKIFTYSDLPKNRLLQIQIRIPEGYSLYEIEARRNDYVIITKEVAYNGSSYQKYDEPRGRFTFRSYLYYLLT